jgi:hypothetical protein
LEEEDGERKEREGGAEGALKQATVAEAVREGI